MVEDSIQMPDTMTCGLFKIYFCENVFNQNEKGKTQKNKKLTKKKTIEMLLNELLILDKEKNK